jgi:hypothetical protein
MKTYRFLALSGLILSFAAGCASNGDFQRVDALRHDPDWPAIRAAAEMEVARKEGNTDWSHSAYFSPQQHTNGVWRVLASGAYPLNKLGDHIEMLIRDNGQVVSYIPLDSFHPR